METESLPLEGFSLSSLQPFFFPYFKFRAGTSSAASVSVPGGAESRRKAEGHQSLIPSHVCSTSLALCAAQAPIPRLPQVKLQPRISAQRGASRLLRAKPSARGTGGRFPCGKGALRDSRGWHRPQQRLLLALVRVHCCPAGFGYKLLLLLPWVSQCIPDSAVRLVFQPAWERDCSVGSEGASP